MYQHSARLTMKILRQVEFVSCMPIFFAQSMLSYGQYELKSSEAAPFCGSILMRFKSLEPPNFFYMLLDSLSNLLRNNDFATA